MKIGIVDYVTGNIASLEMALAELDVTTVSIGSAADFACVDAAILPGVGHFGPAAFSLENSGLRKSLLKLIDQGFPVLGICLGFQLLTASSEEAPGVDGLGVLPGFTQRLRPVNSRIHKVPHLGWNLIRPSSVYVCSVCFTAFHPISAFLILQIPMVCLPSPYPRSSRLLSS